ncbi:MAG: hypothetical protein AAB655_02445 [Patescibacteria group bacterium]
MKEKFLMFIGGAAFVVFCFVAVPELHNYFQKRMHEADRVTNQSVPVYNAYGYVSHVWTAPDRRFDERSDAWWNRPQTLISFACDDGKIVALRFITVEPRLWQGLRAKITYKPLVESFSSPAKQVMSDDGYGYYKLIEVRRLDRQDR